MKRPLRLATVAAAAAALVLPGTAAAHVTVNPDEVAADSFARFAVRVPSEQPNADTTKVTMQLPQGLFFVAFQPKPGWKRTVTMEKLDPPATVFGEKVTERVATVTWAGGRIAPGEFDEFGMSAKVPDAPGQVLAFPALQTYSNGDVERWIGPPDADEPAPRVTLGPKAAEGESTQPTSQTVTVAAAEESGSDDGEGRANLALVFGIAGLAAGVAALGLTLARRR